MKFIKRKKNKKENNQLNSNTEINENIEIHTSCDGCTNQDVNFCTDCNPSNGYKWYIK